MQRYMFINYGDDITVTITASETVCVHEMQTSEEPVAKVVETHTSPQWDLRIPSGAIYGFAAVNNIQFTNPDEEQLKVYTASSKNPWPPPPPPPPLFAAVRSYESHYSKFLSTLEARRPAPGSRGEELAP